MTRVALTIVIVLTCGCRRKQVEATYESDTPGATAPTSAPAIAGSGASDNPIAPPTTTPTAPRVDRSRLPDGGTLNDDPRGPRPAEWKALIDAAMPQLQACFDGAGLPPGEILVKIH
jgi:hypothetical protein